MDHFAIQISDCCVLVKCLILNAGQFTVVLKLYLIIFLNANLAYYNVKLCVDHIVRGNWQEMATEMIVQWYS